MSVKMFGVCDVCGKIIGECNSYWNRVDDRLDEDFLDKWLYGHSYFDLDGRDEFIKLFTEDGQDHLNQDICSLSCMLEGLNLHDIHIVGSALMNMCPQWNFDITLEFDYGASNRHEPWVWGELLNYDLECWYRYEEEEGLHLEDN